MLSRCKQQPLEHKFHFKNPLYSLGASAIDLSLELFPWAAHRDDTANVKLSVALNHGTMIPEFVVLRDGNENDMIKGRKFDFPRAVLSRLIKDILIMSGSQTLLIKGLTLLHGLEQVGFMTYLKSENAMITYLLVSFARHSAKNGWTAQKILRVLQVNLFERKTLKQLLQLEPPRCKKSEPQIRYVFRC